MDNLYDMFPFRNWGDKLSPQEVSRNINNGTNNLKRMGVPCFGYDLNTSESKRNDAFELILDWMVDHCDNWDETEPKIACPEDMFKAKLERIKRIK